MNDTRVRRYCAAFLCLMVLLAVMLVWNLTAGSLDISPAQVLQLLLNPGEEGGAIIWKIRLPRILGAALLGGALSVSGFLLQTFFANPIAESDLEAHLYTAGQPDPELIIRTSGEFRLSGFLLWQCSYSEFYFSDLLWPDFTTDELDRALEAFAGRDRRFGAVK